MLPAKAAPMAIKMLAGSSTKPDATIKPAGLGARDTLRMEAAMLRIVLNGAAYCDIDEQGEFVLVGLVDMQDPAA